MSMCFNPRPGRVFSITRRGRGIDATPCRFETKRGSASQKKNNRLLSTSTRDWWYIFFFYPDLVMTGQRSSFGEINVFSTLQDNSDGVIANIAIKPLPSCLLDNWHHFDI